MIKITKYEKQAIDFLHRANTDIKIRLIGKMVNENWGDNYLRNTYEVTLTKRQSKKEYRFQFWDSVHNTEKNTKPSAYDVLTCLMPYDPGNFEDFCMNYGFDTDSRKAERIYFDVVKEWNGLRSLFTVEELEELAEIE